MRFASAQAETRAAPPDADRLRSLLLSWVLLTAIWVPGLMLVELLVLQRLALTASAMWTAALVPACQALALESLAAPLGLRAALTRLARSLRTPLTALAWTIAAAGLAAGWSFGGSRLLQATATLLLLVAGILFAGAARMRGSANPVERSTTLALALLLLLAVSTHVTPWLDTLPPLLAPGLPPRATRTLLLLLWLGAVYLAIFRLRGTLASARPPAADWLGAAAGIGVLLLVARLLPLRLDVTPQVSAPLGPPTFLLLASACLAAAGTSLFRRRGVSR